VPGGGNAGSGIFVIAFEVVAVENLGAR